jgi:hypothetical protein
LAQAGSVALQRGRTLVLNRYGRELGALAVLCAVYKGGRMLRSGDTASAYRNAHRVWDLERWLHLPNELSEQHALLTSHALIRFANTYYAFVHFPATGAFLLWAFLRRPQQYPPIRRVMVFATGLGLLIELFFPLAPPRMLDGYGFIDTGAKYGPTVYSTDSAHAQLINQFGAMPSLHVTWAVMVAAGVIATCRGKWRWLVLLHPTITAIVVVGTANHYWLDGIVSCLILLLVSFVLLRLPPTNFRRVVALFSRSSQPPATLDAEPVGTGSTSRER